jgi:hypothetical protein
MFAVSGCGLSESGIAADNSPDGAPLSDATAPTVDGAAEAEASGAGPDGADGAQEDVVVTDGASCASDACAIAAPSGWNLVAFSNMQHVACPAGLTKTDIVEQPVAQPNACTCGGCTQTAPPSCSSGNLASSFDLGGQKCATPGVSFAASGCNLFGLPLNGDIALTAPTPMNGSCTSTMTTDSSKVMAMDERICTPPLDQCALACGPLPPPYQTCIMTPGTVACPFTATQHVVGTGVNVTCAPSCPCTVSATSCKGQLTFYQNANCTGQTAAFQDDGSCQGDNFNPASYMYAGTPQGTKCTPGPAPAGMATVAGTVMTVCCP